MIGAIALFWIGLVIHNSAYLPVNSGFDADGHLEYIRHVQTERSLPSADEGWAMYHPPLYYVLTAALCSCAGADPPSPDGILLVRLFNVALLIVGLYAVAGCARLLFPTRPAAQFIAVWFMAFQPMHLYLVQFPTNEVLSATLAVIGCYLVLRIVQVSDAGLAGYVLLGLALGAGLLSKITAIFLIPPIALVLVAHVCTAPTFQETRHRLLKGALVGAVAVISGGWHYLQVWRQFGTPFISNNHPRVGLPWWQDPAYLAPGSFFRFGESLDSPLFSFWYSVWDGWYSTLWSDSYCGGAIDLDFRPPWSYEFMAAGVALSVVMSLGICRGAGQILRQYATRPTFGWTFLLALLGMFALFLTAFAVRHPFLSVIKAFYGLPAIGAVSLLAASGFDPSDQSRRWVRNAVYIFLGIWALNGAASFRIAASSRDVAFREIQSSTTLPDRLRQLTSAVQEHPTDDRFKYLLCILLLQIDRDAAAAEWMAQISDPARRHHLLALTYSKAGRPDQVLVELQRAMDLRPSDRELAEAHAELLIALHEQDKSIEQAVISSCRNVLRLNPYSAKHHEALSRAYRRIGNDSRAAMHAAYAHQLQDGP